MNLSYVAPFLPIKEISVFYLGVAFEYLTRQIFLDLTEF